MSCSKYRLGKV
ncbi:hypothetical protein Tco_0677275, partial [Tanacetum coccineum]